MIAMNATHVDLIYEAAFRPELWREALLNVAAATGCASGALGVWNDLGAPQGFRATPTVEAIVAKHFAGADAEPSPRFGALHRANYPGFIAIDSLLSAEELNRDRVQQDLRGIGLEAQAASAISMPTGDLVCFSFERHVSRGQFSDASLEGLNALRPHLARAGMVAARMRLEEARSTVATLSSLGLPASVLTRQGRVIATNEEFDRHDETFLATALGGLAIGEHVANELFQSAMRVAMTTEEPGIRSIAVTPNALRAAMVLHLLPLRRSAHEIFSGGDLLVVATSVSAHASVPEASILRALFDLAPAEVKLAISLATGSTLQDAARESNIQITTARTYLDRIFRKTGTHQQSQLVALLKSTHTFSSH